MLPSKIDQMKVSHETGSEANFGFERALMPSYLGMLPPKEAFFSFRMQLLNLSKLPLTRVDEWNTPNKLARPSAWCVPALSQSLEGQCKWVLFRAHESACGVCLVSSGSSIKALLMAVAFEILQCCTPNCVILTKTGNQTVSLPSIHVCCRIFFSGLSLFF